MSMLVCPKCRWQAAAPDNWVAPFAICPRCESRIPNPDPAAHDSRSTQPRGRKSGKPQKMPVGYQFTYSESARRRGDAWIKNFAIIGFGVFAVAGTFWAVGLRQANSKRGAGKGADELANPDAADQKPADTPRALESVDAPSGSLEFNPDRVFAAPATAASDKETESLWEATGVPDDALLAPSPASTFPDPSIPSFDWFK